MKKLLYFLFISLFIISVSSCEKDDDVQPETPTTNNPRDTTGNGGSGLGTGGDTTVVVADIGNLKQNHIKAGSTYLDRLYITDIGGYNSGGQDYFTLHMTGENNFLIDFTIKGSSLREGNFSLKKFRLGSSP